jgi:thiol-disulfide isomerase/thioredoxin
MMKLIKLALLTMFFAAPCVQAAYESDTPVDFSLQRLHGDTVSLSDYRQQWVVLNYWATWCAPCREEIPDLSALHQARDDVTVLGLAFEDTEMENFDAFLEEFKPSYPILLVDVYAPPEPFGAPKALPTTVILDPKGYPVKTYLGPVTREDIETFIESQ